MGTLCWMTEEVLARFLLRSCRIGQAWSTPKHRAKADRQRASWPWKVFLGPEGFCRLDDLTIGARVRYAGVTFLFL